MMMRRGSALVMAIWIIVVLSVVVMSFVFEAHQQAGINVYVRERNHVKRLIYPAQMIGEAVILGFKDAKDPEINNGEPDWKDIFEDEDRWCKEKYELKHSQRCTIGPLLLDEEDPDAGVVKIDIDRANSGSQNSININQLYDGGDDYPARWQQILQCSGIPLDLEVEVKEADGRTTKRRNLMNHLIACWNDWRKASANSSKGPITDDPDCESQEGDGAGMDDFYKVYYDEKEKEANGKDERLAAKADRPYPAAGKEREIPDIKELGYIRGFKDFPSVLIGGYLYDGTEYEEEFKKERGSQENPMITGIADLFGVSGSTKVAITYKTTVRQLLTIPGIFQVSGGNEDDDMEDSKELAQAILDTLRVEPEDADDRIAYDDGSGKKWWPYKDETDMRERLDDNYDGDVELGSEVSKYLEFDLSESEVFKMVITAESMGMKNTVECKCYIKESKVRYIEWSENKYEAD